ncbi:MAG: hypothetical protein HYZ54_12430 [Ignavibacteriae bacterium]|nr:hypothetical protein [Ignavibacteriota bacterium]
MDKPMYSPSELIDLVLDGEVEQSQSTPLFTTLATDNDLQVEFHQALSIRRAMNAELQSSAPSAEFTNSLFQRAGIGLASGTSASFWSKAMFKWVYLASTAVISFGIGVLATNNLDVFSQKSTVQNQFPIELPKVYSITVLPENSSVSENSSLLRNAHKPSAKKGVSNNYSNKILSPSHTQSTQHTP